ncbi:MAG TPA: hypothetical protein VN752_06700 [Solirubrobacterales bacterium]|nr:hypothetical protein [Solirubrobacterales bacterium]
MGQRRGRGRGRIGGARGGGGRGRGRGGGDSVGKFLAPHTGRQAGAIANAQAGAEYNPQIREERGAVKGSRKREADLGQWYAQLAADYQGASSQGAAALQAVQDRTSQQLAEASGRSTADLSKLSADDEAFAKLVGGPKDTEGLARIAEAGAAAQRSRVALNAPVAQEQANFVGRLGGEKVAARMQGIEERRAEQRRRDKLKKDLTATRKEKGKARVGKKEEIRQVDRSYVLDRKQLKLSQREARAAEQQAAADAALARIQAAQDARQDSIANRQAQERIGISRKNARTSARSQRATARNQREENKGGLSTAEKRARGEHSSDAMSAAKALLGIKVPKTAKQWAQFEAALIEKLGSSYSAEAARAVAKLRQAQAAKRRGGYDKRVRRGEVAGPPSPRGR